MYITSENPSLFRKSCFFVPLDHGIRRCIDPFQIISEETWANLQDYIGDGDSKSCATVSKAMPYRPLVHIVKEECFTDNKMNGKRIP